MKEIDAEELDRLFDQGSDELYQYMDLSTGTRDADDQWVSVLLSAGLVALIDSEADAEGVDRQTLIERWLIDRVVEIDAANP
ncbi:MAG: hypothetical protein LBK95_16150 [Bifidobacteriaceae bacterium]|jgi:hypothetical protein|nr:hypothetical protein [Bifidobacteriaceae bacterium]